MKTPHEIVQGFSVNADGWYFDSDEGAEAHDAKMEALIEARDAEHRAELAALAADNDAMGRRFIAKCADFGALRVEIEALERMADDQRQLRKEAEQAATFLRNELRGCQDISEAWGCDKAKLTAEIERFKGDLAEARGLVRTAHQLLHDIRQEEGLHDELDDDTLAVMEKLSLFVDKAAVPPPAESTPVQRISMKETSWGGRCAVTQPSLNESSPVCTACPGPALLGACSHPGCKVNKESCEVGRMMRENDKDGLAAYLNRNVADKAKRAVERINAAPPDDIRARLAEAKAYVLGQVHRAESRFAVHSQEAYSRLADHEGRLRALEEFVRKLAQDSATQGAVEAKGEPGTCYTTDCRYYGQRHATPHEPREGEPGTHAHQYVNDGKKRCEVCGLRENEGGHPKGAKP